MKSSPKPNETPPSTGSKTPASGRKMVQARLPFKTLSGSEPPFTPSNETTEATAAATAPLTSNSGNGTTTVKQENRKRKQCPVITPDDGIRAPKMNRTDADKTDDDEIMLISSEAMEASCDLNVNQTKDDKNVNETALTRNSESKENVCMDTSNLNESIILDSDDEEVKVLEKEEVKKTPKAKKSLNVNDSDTPKSETRKSKRISDANLIKIKLPMTKKAKEAKKAKKQKKSPNNDGKSESSSDEKMDNNEPSTSSSTSKSLSDKDQSALDDSVLEENDDLDDSVLDESITLNTSLVSEPVTPNQKLTPKQIQRRAESEKKALERQRAKLERDLKLQEEKEQKRREREEKEEQRKREKEERERKILEEKREKEEQKQREKEERERKIQEEKDLRNREKEEKKREREEKERKIQEEKDQKKKEREDKERKLQEEKEEKIRKKEEERKKMEEEKEAEKLKNRKTSAAFKKFFVPKKVDGKTGEISNEIDPDQAQQKFMSFQVKEGMKMAPICRRTLNNNEKSTLEKYISSTVSPSTLYLAELKENKFMPRKSTRTLQDDEDEKCSNDEDIFVIDDAGSDIQVIEEIPKKLYRAKFFRFNENRRPPYYGTWRKRSNFIGPRKPFGQDTKIFNYEIDSDDEWEEEEPGESLHGSDDEKDQESEDDYDIDNEFFVPHGHLSDEELQDEDGVDYDNNAEDHKIKMQLIQKQFDKEMKKKTQKLKPRVIGLIWQNADGTQPDNCSNGVWNLFNSNAALFVGPCVKLEPPTATINEPTSDDENTGAKSVRRLKISEKEIPDLIRLINGNTYRIDFLTEEFRAFIAKQNPGQREYTTASIKHKIRELAIHQRCPEEGPMFNKKCWYVPIPTRKRYNVNDLTFPNEWVYTIPPRRPIESADLLNENSKSYVDDKEKKPNSQGILELNEDSNGSCGLSETLTPELIKQAASKPNSYNIAKFIRVLSEEEKKKQFDPITFRGPTIDLTDSDTERASISRNNAKKQLKIKRKSLPKTDKDAPMGKRTSTATTAGKASPVLAAGGAAKKRVNLLMSGPRGQDFSPQTKNRLVTQYLSSNSDKRPATDVAQPTNSTKPAGTSDGSKRKKVDSVIVID